MFRCLSRSRSANTNKQTLWTSKETQQICKSTHLAKELKSWSEPPFQDPTISPTLFQHRWIRFLNRWILSFLSGNDAIILGGCLFVGGHTNPPKKTTLQFFLLVSLKNKRQPLDKKTLTRLPNRFFYLSDVHGPGLEARTPLKVWRSKPPQNVRGATVFRQAKGLPVKETKRP